ncbi:unnamed protein product [Polarella glacialis]|uniref:Divinyl chlorophyllide a 8-vinyl-reductase, chloroplastic n=1 Tax=Polarella glacialis TaxID=89957 RepID=A0A813EMB4_POLGL|nr:unnamed protein product [Polarella glacialis]
MSTEVPWTSVLRSAVLWVLLAVVSSEVTAPALQAIVLQPGRMTALSLKPGPHLQSGQVPCPYSRGSSLVSFVSAVALVLVCVGCWRWLALRRRRSQRVLRSVGASVAAKLEAAAARAASSGSEPQLAGPKLRVLVFGSTGYIGQAVVHELAARGHQVTAIARAHSGIVGGHSLADVEQYFSGTGRVRVVEADVTDEASLTSALLALDARPEVAICCLASRFGGRADAFKVDFRATVNCIHGSRALKVSHFVLLSAICVQRPLLAFQQAKLLAEAELKDSSSMRYSIVRPTAFIKSLVSQVGRVRSGYSFVVFGSGEQVRCAPLSQQDLASFLADCLWRSKALNATLPIAGPGPALSKLEQALLIFHLLGKEPKLLHVPIGALDFVASVLRALAFILPRFAEAPEYCRIIRYYATESMLLLDQETGCYSELLTPGYGRTTLLHFLSKALRDEHRTLLEAQSMGDAGLWSE